MAYTEVTRQSWFSRVGGAIKGVVVGILLVGIAVPLLFWNEGRAVRRYKTLKQGAGEVVSITADRINEANSGKLIHVSGRAETDDILADPVFGVVVNAIHLRRDVGMYQWKENASTRKKTRVGGGTETVKTYTYEKIWSDSLIRSEKFQEVADHENPAAMPYESRTYVADKVTLGAFNLSPSQVNKITNFTQLAITPDMPIPGALGDESKIHDSGFYIGTDPASPQVGDIRVTFKAVYPTEVSVIAKQVGNTFEAYLPPRAGGSIELLAIGIVSAEAMFESAQASNRLLAWILRLTGFLLFLAGFNLIFRPLSVVADVLPIMGKIVGAGTGIIALLLAVMLSLAVIAVSWVAYLPLLGIPLLLFVVALIVVVVRKLKAAKTGSVTSGKSPSASDEVYCPPLMSRHIASGEKEERAQPD